jgi:mannosyltransferase
MPLNQGIFQLEPVQTKVMDEIGQEACKRDGRGAARWPLAAVLIIATGVVSSLHLGRTLSTSEAYTAMAVSQPTYAAVIRAALRFDPGKPPLYQILLHSFVLVAGDSEAALRAPSVIFSMVTVGLFLVLGTEMFAPAVGVAAALLWALGPLGVFYAGWARMYAMLVALCMAQLLLLWRLRSQRCRGWHVLGCGLLGAAMLYTHLGGALLLGAETAMLARATWRGERTVAAWAALAVAVILFLPFIPIASRQTHELVAGHWVDWIGPAHQTSLIRKITIFSMLGIVVVTLAFGPRTEAVDREPIRWCAAIGLIPIIALAAGSLAIRPMFTVRYVAPSWALLTLLIAEMLTFLGERGFRRATVAIATLLVCLIPHYPWYDPWRDIARVVSGGSSREPVFFESGYVASNASETNPEQGFPQGFLRVPFDRYFSGPNQRMVVNPSKPAAAREAIGAAASANRGAWLITGFGEEKAKAELPAESFRIEKKNGSDYATLYHIIPLERGRYPAH